MEPIITVNEYPRYIFRRGIHESINGHRTNL